MKEKSTSLHSLRIEYAGEPLDEKTVQKDPISQFRHWFDEASKAQLPEPNAMTLSTADDEGIPSSRTVLLKEFSGEGFVFFTNYESRKGQDIAVNPKVSILFFWPELARQVRIDGAAQKLSREKNVHYFASRPRGAQIGASVSAQSSKVESRTELELNYEAFSKAFDGKDIPCPGHWGGYLIVPHSIEFWQGRENRLHDRLRYDVSEKGEWVLSRRAP